MGEEGRDRDPRIRGKREGTEIPGDGGRGKGPRSQEGGEGRDRDPRRGGEEGRDRDSRRWGKRRLYTVNTIMISASRWAAMRAILMFH